MASTRPSREYGVRPGHPGGKIVDLVPVAVDPGVGFVPVEHLTRLFQSTNLVDVFHHEPFNPDDPEDQVRMEAFRAQVDTLESKVEPLTEALAKQAGIYVTSHQFSPVPTPFGVKPALLLTANVGDLAFSKRIQDPEAAEFNRVASEMGKAAEIDGFLDARAELEASIRRDETDS